MNSCSIIQWLAIQILAVCSFPNLPNALALICISHTSRWDIDIVSYFLSYSCPAYELKGKAYTTWDPESLREHLFIPPSVHQEVIISPKSGNPRTLINYRHKSNHPSSPSPQYFLWRAVPTVICCNKWAGPKSRQAPRYPRACLSAAWVAVAVPPLHKH